MRRLAQFTLAAVAAIALASGPAAASDRETRATTAEADRLRSEIRTLNHLIWSAYDSGLRTGMYSGSSSRLSGLLSSIPPPYYAGVSYGYRSSYGYGPYGANDFGPSYGYYQPSYRMVSGPVAGSESRSRGGVARMRAARRDRIHDLLARREAVRERLAKVEGSAS